MRLPIFNPHYDPLLFSVSKGFFAFTTPLAGIFLAYDSLRIPLQLPALREEVSGPGALRPRSFHLLIFRRSQQRAETAPNGKGRYGYPPSSFRGHTAAHKGEHVASTFCATGFSCTCGRSAVTSAKYSWCW